MCFPFLSSLPTLGMPHGGCGAELIGWVPIFPGPCHTAVLLKVLAWVCSVGGSILRDTGLSPVQIQADAVGLARKRTICRKEDYFNVVYEGWQPNQFMPGLVAETTTRFSQASGRRGEAGLVMEKQG